MSFENVVGVVSMTLGGAAGGLAIGVAMFDVSWWALAPAALGAVMGRAIFVMLSEDETR